MERYVIVCSIRGQITIKAPFETNKIEDFSKNNYKSPTIFISILTIYLFIVGETAHGCFLGDMHLFKNYLTISKFSNKIKKSKFKNYDRNQVSI